ncbi:unnamed protein product [Albugo candida]|uniref:peptidylprolyl isomerase n=1 Tax=Albugo candida TaxID=65357 RepID=A0A024G103_9STRA|nr:unnamed protein product [Albugo candida]|eukprot:CCI40527.1 unnamed protein product [Albugo candida]
MWEALMMSKVIKGWDIGVISMKLGEIARFIIKPEYAYGSQGCAPKIEPDETLDFEIELVRFGDPLPRFPTSAELAETRKQQHEENKKMLEENPPPTVDERVRLATEEKQKGNSCIAEKDYEAAQKHYDSGFVNIFYAKDEWDQLLSEQDRAEINQIKAISLDATASKAHFRRGLVYTEKLKQEFEKERNGQFWVIDKGVKYAKEAQESFRKASELCSNADAGIARGMLELERQKAQLQRYASKYKEDEKRLYKEQIFDRMVAKNKKLQEQEAKRAMEDVFKDMPALE